MTGAARVIACDVAVIGGGTAGFGTALAAARRGTHRPLHRLHGVEPAHDPPGHERELAWLRKYVESAERQLYGGGGEEGLEQRLRAAGEEHGEWVRLEERALAELPADASDARRTLERALQRAR